MISRNWTFLTAGTAVAGLAVASLSGLGTTATTQEPAEAIDLTTRTEQVMTQAEASLSPLGTDVDTGDSPDLGPDSPSSLGAGNSPDSPGDSPDSAEGARRVNAPVVKADPAPAPRPAPAPAPQQAQPDSPGSPDYPGSPDSDR